RLYSKVEPQSPIRRWVDACRMQAFDLLCLLLAHRIDAPAEVDDVSEARGPRLGSKLQVIDVDAIQVGQCRIPVVGVALQLPHHPRLQALMPKRAGPRIRWHAPQIVIVLL